MSGTAPFSTKDRILGAAEELFAQYGFSGTSLRQVTSRADVNIAAVNYHFGSKENLVNEVFRRRMDEMTEKRLAALKAAVEQRPNFAGESEGLRSTWAAPPAEILVRRFCGKWTLRMRSQRESDQVVLNVGSNHDFPNQLLPLQNFFSIHDFLSLVLKALGGSVDDR